MEIPFETLKGLVLTNIEGGEESAELVLRADLDQRTFRMYHQQSCCEDVWLDEIIGDPADILFTPILEAVVKVNPDEMPEPDEENGESFTWTFYEIRTKKGTVVLRWYGRSNGYYSESVIFSEVPYDYTLGDDERDDYP